MNDTVQATEEAAHWRGSCEYCYRDRDLTQCRGFLLCDECHRIKFKASPFCGHFETDKETANMLKKKKKKERTEVPGAESRLTPQEEDAKKRQDDGWVEKKRYTQRLPVRIEDFDVALKAAALAKTIKDKEVVMEQRSQAMRAYRKQITFFDERLKELGESVGDKTELRPVECVDWLILEKNEVHVMRMDTAEIIDRRAPTPLEQQADLPLEEPKTGAKRQPQKEVDDKA